MKKCVFAGTFDPFTVGHSGTVETCLKLFDEVTVAVAKNNSKQQMFPAEERLEMLRAVYAGQPRVKPLLWEGTAADLLKAEGTPFYVRGLRNGADFEYEMQDFYANRDFDGEMVTLFFPSEQPLLHVSSTLVKNCILFGKPFSRYVPREVYEYIQERKLCSGKK